MLKFEHTVKDPLGIHARPAGQIAKLAKGFADSTITVEKNGNAVRAVQLMKLMGLGIKNGDVITVTVEGGNEEAAFAAVKEFFAANL